MQQNVNPRKLQILAGVCLAVSAASVAWAQAAPALQSATGTVTKVDAATRSATIKTDAGQEFAVTLDTKATVRRIPAGETDLTKATVIQIGDVAVGDRVQARGKIDGQSVTATQVWVMASSEVAKTQQAQQADWDKRGVSGLVTAVSSDSVTIGVRNLNGVKPMVITLGTGAIVRKYAPDSVSFAEAKTAALGDIKIGDQVRARGDKNEDSSKMAAVEIVSGTFKTMAGVILSIDAANNQMQVRDLDTKKPVTVKINRESSVKKLQPQLSQAIATRLHADPAAAGDASGRGQKGGGGRGQGGGRGGDGGGVRVSGDLAQMIDSSPNVTLAEMKAGDAIVVSSTVGATAGQITAIKLLAGVEPILTKPGTQEMSLPAWNLGGLGGGAD
jgi:transcription antitermination factor NusG